MSTEGFGSPSFVRGFRLISVFPTKRATPNPRRKKASPTPIQAWPGTSHTGCAGSNWLWSPTACSRPPAWRCPRPEEPREDERRNKKPKPGKVARTNKKLACRGREGGREKRQRQRQRQRQTQTQTRTSRQTETLPAFVMVSPLDYRRLDTNSFEQLSAHRKDAKSMLLVTPTAQFCICPALLAGTGKTEEWSC